MSELATSLPPEDASLLRAKRGDVLRALYATDDAPPLTADCIRLLAALNDLLQCVNPSIGGLLGEARTERLASNVDRTVLAIPPPRTLGDALARHATLAGLARLVRHDATVKWWTGSAELIGRPTPARLLAWPKLRRVREQKRETGLFSLATSGRLSAQRYIALLQELLSRSPLTELLLAGQNGQPFSLSPSLASVSAVPLGRAIIARIVEAASPDVQRAWATATLRK